MYSPSYEPKEYYNRNLLKNIPQSLINQQENIISKNLKVFINIYKCYLVISILFSSMSIYLGTYISQLAQYNLEGILLYVSVAIYLISSTTAFFMNKITNKIKMWRNLSIINFLTSIGILVVSCTLVILSIYDECCGIQFQIDGQQVVGMCSNIQNSQNCSSLSTSQVMDRIQNKDFIVQVCLVYTCNDQNVVIIKSALIYWICILNLFCYFMLNGLFMYLFIKKIHKVETQIKMLQSEYLYQQSSNASSYSRESGMMQPYYTSN